MIEKHFIKMVVALVAVAVSSPALACIPTPPEEKVKELDVDGDNKVSAQEYKDNWVKQGKEDLKRLNEGREFSEKYEVGFDYERRKRQLEEFRSPENAQKFFDELDTNKDGFITADEYGAYSEAHLQKGC